MTAPARRSPKTWMDGKPCDSRPANTLCMRGRSEGHLYGYGYGEMISPQMDYGFIQPQAGLTNVIKGQKVSYDVVTTDRGRTAAGKRKTG